jgi:DNA-binding MarR family transcriptional regulator
MTLDGHDINDADRERPASDTPAPTQMAGCQADPGEPPTLDIGALTVLCRAANLVRHHLDTHVLYDAHLTWTSWDILQLVVGQPAIATRQVAASAAVSKSLVTKISNTLVERDLIHRGRETGDQRLVRLYPTSRGQRLVQDLMPQLGDAYERYIATGRGTVDDAFRVLLRDLFLPATATGPANAQTEEDER